MLRANDWSAVKRRSFDLRPFAAVMQDVAEAIGF
jgi:hypothetical protein